jgi:Domain of unknown function (DUF5123)/Domain of unknown function (DUF4957)
MKKIIINIGLIPGLLLLLSLNACNEKIDPVVSELSFSRAFTPTGLSAQISNITTVTLSWVAVTNVDHYVVEIYNGIDIVPGNLLYTTDVDATATTYKYVLPAGDTQFSARIKVVSSLDGVAESKWISVGFKTAPENLFLGYISELSGLGTCTVRWKPGSVATALVFDNGTQTSYAISAAEAIAGVKIVTGIAKGKYQIILMNSTFVRGRTNTFIEGDVFLSAGGDLAAAITALPAGGVILLKNGDNFSFTGPVALTKSIKIRGVFSTSLPTMFVALNAATFQMFNIGASLTPSDSLVFQNMNISGYPDNSSANTRLRGMFDQDVTFPCNIGLIKFQNCVAHNFDRHLIRLRGTATQVIGNIVIDGCIMYDYAFGSNYGVINSSAASSTIKNISISNSTIFNTRGAIISYSSGTACSGITVKNCTFNQLAMDAATGRYIIDLNGTAGTGVITVSNCIFGSTASIANGIRPNTMTMSITGSYYTSDFNDGIAFPIKSFMTVYTGASTALWTNPVAGMDFHFLDAGFAGKNSAGDPRWKP